MDDQFGNIKQFLSENINDMELFESGKLYKRLIMHPSFEDKFNKNDSQNLFFNMAYKSLINFGIPNQYIKNISDLNGLKKKNAEVLISKLKLGVTYEDFLTLLNKLAYIGINEKMVENDNCASMLLRFLSKKNMSREMYWDFFRAPENTGKHGYTKKIYLPINNNSLHLFTSQFIAKCEEYDIAYDFKINSNDSFSRSDNVVIYANDEECLKYVSIINEVVTANSKIKYSKEKLNPFAYHYNDYIAMAIGDDSETESHSSILCNKICELRDNATTRENFLGDVETLLKNNIAPVKKFCEEYFFKKNNIMAMELSRNIKSDREIAENEENDLLNNKKSNEKSNMHLFK